MLNRVANNLSVTMQAVRHSHKRLQAYNFCAMFYII